MRTPDDASTHPEPGREKGSGALFGRLLTPFPLWTAALLVGLVGWAYSLRGAEADRAWLVLLVNFLYFTPLAAGLVVWPAVVLVCRGAWAAGIERPALSGIGFAPFSLAALGGLYLGRTHWAAWMTRNDLPNAAWLNTGFLFARDAIALLVFWGLAAWFAVKWRERPRALAGWLVLTYALVFSLLAFDLAMALDPRT